MVADGFRGGYAGVRDLLRERLAEPPPGRIQLLAGPRQVGKTTLLLETADDLGPVALYHAADDPAAGLPGSWERLWRSAEETATARGRAVVLLDEAHLLPGWAARLKGEWDRLRRRRVPVQVVATGSSALRLATGSRESLAGRFERLVLAHWDAASLARAFRLPPAEAAALVVSEGAYPGAFPLRADRARWTAYLRDAVIEPAVGRDLLALAPVRRPALLRQVYSVCASSPARILSLQKIRGLLEDAGALETVAHYLALLEEAFLVAALPKHSDRPHRLRSAPPKILPLSNALLAAAAPLGAPDPSREPDRYGPWVENACLAHAWNAGQRVAYWREEPWEVDGVLDGSWGRWAVEVKTGAVEATDLRGLLECVRRFPALRPLLVGEERFRGVAARAGVSFTSWTRFLLEGPPGA